MKLDERRFSGAALAKAGPRVVLLHGDDPILISHRARSVAEALQGGRANPFGSAVLDGTDHARAAEELASPMLGGDQVVRLRDATDAATGSVERSLALPGEGVLLVEACALGPRSRLRLLVERHDRGVAVLCRGTEPRDLEAAAVAALRPWNVTIDSEARAVLASRGDSYGAVLRSVELAALLVGDHGTIRVADVLSLDQDAGAAATDEFVLAAAAGRRRQMDAALERLLLDGTAPAALIRSLLLFLARIRAARIAVDRGATVSTAVGALRPPVFFRLTGAMEELVAEWSGDQLDRACLALWRADLQCRQTGAPATALCRRAAASIAHQAHGARTARDC